MENGNELDPVGLKTAAETGKMITSSTLNFLSSICASWAEEFGEDLSLKRRHKRLMRVHRLVEESRGKLTHDGANIKLAADERVVFDIIDGGSKSDDELLISMWGGLLAASCVEGEPNDTNLIFVDALKVLTTTQAKIIQYICTNCKVLNIEDSIVVGVAFTLEIQSLIAITGIADLGQLNSELEALSARGYFGDGQKGLDIDFNLGSVKITSTKFTPTTALLTLYSKTQGFKGRIADFYVDQVVPLDNDNWPNALLAVRA